MALGDISRVASRISGLKPAAALALEKRCGLAVPEALAAAYWRRGSGMAQTKCRRQSEAACLCISGFFGDKRRWCNPAARAKPNSGRQIRQETGGDEFETWSRHFLGEPHERLPAIGYAIVRQIQSALKEREVRDGIRLVQ